MMHSFFSKTSLLTSLILVLAGHVAGQRPVDSLIPKNLDLGQPLGITTVLAGNFGELRSNHFHTGLDIKTNRKVGYRIYSIQDGHVSRINISPWGYGKAIYVDHPNGLTSVYAHLDHFPEKVDSVIRRLTRERKDNFIDMQLSPEDIPVKKGEVIAYSGNTGSSGGPHLHFEVRDTRTEIVLNPQLLGYKIKDTRPPSVRGLLIYALSPEGYPIPGKRKEYDVRYYKGKYTVNKGVKIKLPSDFVPSNGFLGLAYRSDDLYDAASNRCGIYTSTLSVNGAEVHKQTMDLMEFGVNRYLNEHTDYHLFKKYKKGYHRNFKSKTNGLPIYDKDLNGLIPVSAGGEYDITYLTKDIVGNATNINFDLTIESGSSAGDFSWPADVVFPDSSYSYHNDEFFIQAPRYTFYAPVAPEVKAKDDDLFCRRHSFADFLIGINKHFEVGLKVKGPIKDTTKLCLMVMEPSGGERCLNGHVENGWLMATTRYNGTYFILADSTAPTILNGTMTSTSSLSAKSELYAVVGDDLSGIQTVEAYMNDQWVNLYMDDGKVHFNLKGLEFGTKNVLTLIVRDSRANESVKTWTYSG